MSLVVKRLVDVVGAMIAMVVLAPFALSMAVIVRISLGRPILFLQDRPGRNGRLFKIIKFRTMSCDTDIEGRLQDDEARLGRVGRAIRSTSLDELPQLLNVLLGNMSLVGPRPLLPEYLPLYSTRQSMRHLMRPGITGYAQVSGRNDLPWAQRLELDVWYVENWSLWLDFKILIRTVAVVFGRRGIGRSGQSTTEKFRGEG